MTEQENNIFFPGIMTKKIDKAAIYFIKPRQKKNDVFLLEQRLIESKILRLPEKHRTIKT